MAKGNDGDNLGNWYTSVYRTLRNSSSRIIQLQIINTSSPFPFLDHQQKYTTEYHKLTSNYGKLTLYSKMINMNNTMRLVLVVIKFIGNTMLNLIMNI